MAVNYRASLKTTRMNAVVTDIDSGAGAGTLELCTASYAAVLAVVTLNDPCGSVSGSVLTFSGFPKAASSVMAGTPVIARIKESGGTVIVDGLTVGTSGTDIVLSSATIASGNTVTISSATLTHA